MIIIDPNQPVIMITANTFGAITNKIPIDSRFNLF